MSKLAEASVKGRAARQRRLRFRAEADPAAPRFAEFFAGIGLMRWGLEQAGWRVAFANDIDAKKFGIYDGCFGDAHEHFVLEDIRRLDPAGVPDVELATASFPCTDLSLAGGRRGIHSGESSTFWAFVDVLDRLGLRRPPLVLLENVTGFLTSHGGDDFRLAMQALNRLGYWVDPFVLDARWFAPQSRPRLFVVGRRLSFPPGEGRPEGRQDNGAEPEINGETRTLDWKSIEPSRIRPKQLVEAIRAIGGDVHWAIRDLPNPPQRSPLGLADVLESIPHASPIWWSEERTEYLLNQMSDRHRAVADAMIARRAWSYGAVFRRVRRQADGSKRSMAELRTDGLAGCLRTPKGGSGRQILWKAGYGRYHARLLTPVECARLMGADGFETDCSFNDALFGFGDAVCATAVQWIGEHYLNPLLNERKGGAVAYAFGS